MDFLAADDLYCMVLYSYQTPDFSLLTGTVNVAKSEFYCRLPKAPSSYAELARKLGTDQIIWSSSTAERRMWRGRVEWQLDVPYQEFLAIIDKHVWNKILGNKCGAPEDVRIGWLNEAIAAEPYNADKRTAYIAAKQVEYDRPEPLDDLWKRIVIKRPSCEAANILLRHPLPTKWVSEVTSV